MSILQLVMSYIFHNWQFLLTLSLAFAALVISIMALRSSRKMEVVIGSDEPSVDISFYKSDNQTICNLTALGEIKKAYLKLGDERKRLDNLNVDHSEVLNFPFVARGTRWEIGFIDPATGKKLRERGLVRY